MIAPTALAENNRDFGLRKFLATIGEGRQVVAIPKNGPSSGKETRLTQSFTSKRAGFGSLWYPRLARKQPWAY